MAKLNISIPTIEEVHQIAYVTMRGWSYDSFEDTWSKEGYSHCLSDGEYDDMRESLQYRNDYESFREDLEKAKSRFELGDAYWIERGCVEDGDTIHSPPPEIEC